MVPLSFSYPGFSFLSIAMGRDKGISFHGPVVAWPEALATWVGPWMCMMCAQVGGWRLLIHSEQRSIYMQGWVFGSQCTVGDSVGHCRTDMAQVADSLCLPFADACSLMNVSQ